MPPNLCPAPPTFPFSSPITEEIPSPTSSSPDRDETQKPDPKKTKNKTRTRTRDVDVEVLSTSRQTPLVHSQRNAHKKSMIADTDSHPVDDLNAAGTGPRQQKPVGLNLVTDFDSLVVPQAKQGKPTLVDLTDLKTLCRKRERERSAQKIRGILKKRTSRARVEARLAPTTTSATLDGQDQRKRRKSELSLSDRPIPIGLTVSYADSDPHASGSGNRSRIRAQDDHQYLTTPLTPSIVVTPAGEDSFWEDDEVFDSPQHFHPRPRVASSVYSQATPVAMFDDEIPPVPAIPANHSSKVATPVQGQPREQEPRSMGKARFSTATVFEEDSPESASSASASASKRKAIDRLSINTDTNRHQSQGWWTYLLSPLFKRSSTATSKTPTSPQPAPEPDEWWEDDEKEISCFSPETPPSTTIDESSVSRNPFLDTSNPSSNESKSSGIFAGQAIQGCAAEYYQACAHELFSGTPYFQCVDHVCSLTPRGVISPNSERRGHHRFSGSTAINETPVVKTPAVNNNNKTTSPAGKHGFLVVSVPETKTQDAARPVTPVTPFYLPVDREKAVTTTNQAAARSTSPVAPFYIAPHAAQQPLSPNPISPAFQQATEGGSIPLSRVQNTSHTESNQVNIYAGHSEARSLRHPEPVVTRESSRHSASSDEYDRERSHNETRRKRHEKEEKLGKKASGLWRGRGLFSKKGCLGRSGSEGRKKRRWCVGIALLLLVAVIIALLLAVFLSRTGHGGTGHPQTNSTGSGPGDLSPSSPSNPGSSSEAGPGQWLNLTGYPPMPTGIATIAGPKATIQRSGCIHPTTLWSCALPPEMHDANQPYDADEPSFRVDIRFRNGTYPRSTMLVPSAKANVSASGTDWTPSPSPASQLDQRFLGNSTDGNEAPFDGEETPFYMSFLSSSSSSSGSDSSGSKQRRSSFPNLTDIIPSPATQNGTAAAATLYPLPSTQPIRLFNRGKDTEHYGFYTYFDRSIFLATQAPLNGGFLDSNQLTDRDGGSSIEDAQVRCTWAQTRFLVQIWTGQTKSLLQQDSQSKGNGGDSYTYKRPGSFPYPVSITLDRHGGSAKEKMVYCYGMDDDGGRGLNATAVKLQLEDRGFSGSLTSPAPGIFNSTQNSANDAVDGGDGGCKCQWTNWT